MKRALVAVAVVALVAGAYLLGAAGDDGEPLRRVVVGASTGSDDVRDKWVTAECPDGYTVFSGGAQVPHANDTPGVSLYWSAPYEDHGTSGWWAAAQDTAVPVAGESDRAWLLQVQAICLSGVEDGGGTALAPETFTVPGDG